MSNSKIQSKSRKAEISLPELKEKEMALKGLTRKKRKVSPGKEGSTVSRVSPKPSEEKSTGKLDKPIQDRLVETSQVKEQISTEPQVMPDEMFDMLNVIMTEFADISTIAAFNQASKNLKKYAQNTDFKKLDEFSKAHQWSLKEEMAVRLLLLAAESESKPTIENLKNVSTLNPNTIDIHRSPTEALALLSKIEANYEQIQGVYNNILQSLPALSPMAATFGWQMLSNMATCALLFFAPTALLTLATAAYVGHTYNQGLDLSAGLKLLSWYAMVTAIPMVPIVTVGITAAVETVTTHASSIALFRTAITGTLDALTKNLNTP